MTWFTESPWTLVTVGVIVELVLLAALIRTGRGALLWAIAAVAALTAGLVTIERWIVTDRESISQSLDELAKTLATNDLQAVLGYISPSATEVRQLAKTGMPQITIKSTKSPIIYRSRSTKKRILPQPWQSLLGDSTSRARQMCLTK